MVRGFYEVGSGIMAQQKVINTIANNIANSNTAGYKSQQSVTTSFDSMLTSRVGETATGADSVKSLYDRSWLNVVSDTVTSYGQGAVKPTERDLDFCISGNGFFQIESKNGKTYYTRNGNFNLDDEGYLYLQGGGRVKDANGSDIYLGTDTITCGSNGELYNTLTGAYMGKIGLYDFDDYKTMIEFNDVMYTTTSNPIPTEAVLENQKLEASNIDLAGEITNAMQAQNLLQSQANILQMYADILKEGVTRIAEIK